MRKHGKGIRKAGRLGVLAAHLILFATGLALAAVEHPVYWASAFGYGLLVARLLMNHRWGRVPGRAADGPSG